MSLASRVHASHQDVLGNPIKPLRRYRCVVLQHLRFSGFLEEIWVYGVLGVGFTSNRRSYGMTVATPKTSDSYESDTEVIGSFIYEYGCIHGVAI